MFPSQQSVQTEVLDFVKFSRSNDEHLSPSNIYCFKYVFAFSADKTAPMKTKTLAEYSRVELSTPQFSPPPTDSVTNFQKISKIFKFSHATTSL